MCSGHTVVIHTDDPINRSLPSGEPLKMQWNLNRVAALSRGASEISDPRPSSDDDYNDVLIANWT